MNDYTAFMMQYLTENIWHGAVITAAACLLIFIAVIDIRTLEIPNISVLIILGLGLVDFFICDRLVWQEVLIGFGCISVPMILMDLVMPGSFGGGDIKLCAACGVLLGWRCMLAATIIAVIAGGVYGAALLVLNKRKAKEHFAFGPFLAAGFIMMLIADCIQS